MLINILFIIVLSYLVGSIPFSLIFAKMFKGVDVREVGTKNVGASNALISAGKRAGILAAIFDLAKGLAVILFARSLGAEDYLVVLAGLAVILGHDFSLYLGFKGGKGVATTVGVIMALNPYAVWIGAFLYLAFLLVTRYLILSTLLVMAILPLIFFYFRENIWYVGFAVLSAFLMAYTHRGDIKRLLEGKEIKFQV